MSKNISLPSISNILINNDIIPPSNQSQYQSPASLSSYSYSAKYSYPQSLPPQPYYSYDYFRQHPHPQGSAATTPTGHIIAAPPPPPMMMNNYIQQHMHSPSRYSNGTPLITNMNNVAVVGGQGYNFPPSPCSVSSTPRQSSSLSPQLSSKSMSSMDDSHLSHQHLLNAHHGISKQRKTRNNLPKETTYILLKWLNEHLNHPYPNSFEKNQLMISTGLNQQQLSNWFINARRRKIKVLKQQQNLNLSDDE